INGKGEKVWVHSNFVFDASEDKPDTEKTSKLVRINNSQVKIYESIYGESFKAGSKYTDVTYYVKEKAKASDGDYYLISTEPSAKKGTVGWVRAGDVKSYSHTSVDKKSKTFYVKGNGNARSKAWGAKKDRVYSDLSKYKNESFEVNLTEKVGNNTWYRGKLDGETVWLHSNFVYDATKSKTSKLGRIKTSDVKIYEAIEGEYFTAGKEYTDLVYYIKEQAKTKDDTYYLLSTEPSADKGVIGWVRSSDLNHHTHKSVDKKSKVFYVKGNGNARSKAWGGKKDRVYSNLSKYKNEPFKVNLTEKVGNNTWYRGKLDGKTVWLHSNFVTDRVELSTSRLGRIKSQGASIYKDKPGEGASFTAGSKYMDSVYYIKKEVREKGNTYYLISTEPSAKNGVIGWIDSKDINHHSHKTVDKKSKTFYVKGNGNARSKAWGGKKDHVFSDLTKYAGEMFKVNMTEKVGNNTWYRGKLDGKTVWLHSNFVSTASEKYTNYNLTLNQAINIQYKQN